MTGSKVWLITGSSRGLGRAFVQAVLEAGHRVVAAARNPLQLSDVVSKYGDRVRAVALDVTNEVQAQHAIDAAIETFGGLDVLVNNAGYGNVCPVEDTSLAEFRAQIETNLFGVIIMTKAALPLLPGATSRAHHPGNIDRRTNWTDRARTICSGEVRRRGLLGITVQRSRASRHKSDDRRTRRLPHRLCRRLHGTSRRPPGVRCHSRRYSALPARL